jgi:hypothetical protein
VTQPDPTTAPGRYRKRPVVVEAIQFAGTGDSCTAVTAFFGSPYAGTHRWKHTTNDGGWIKPDVFADVYEAAGDADA